MSPMRFLPLVVVVAAAALPGCIIHEQDPPNPYGDIAFNWSFAGNTDCASAGVDVVDVVMLDGNGEVALNDVGEPCVGGGLVFTDMLEDVYTVSVDGVDRSGVVLYSGDFTLRVVGGQTNDAGLVTLDALDAPPPPPVSGTLSMAWDFLYPTDGNTIEDCALAGVNSIDVHVTPEGSAGAPFDATYDCATAAGVDVTDLPEGRYGVRVQAYGTYHGADVALYDSNDLVVDVLGGTTNDLGALTLPRVVDNFSDFDVAWTFANDSCASAGVSSVTLSFMRFGFAQPEDSFSVPCGAANVVRRTFVPGSYVVSASAPGSSSTYVAQATVDLPPASVAQVDLSLAP